MPDRDYIEKLAQGRYKGELRNAIRRAIADSAGKVRVTEVEKLIREGKLEQAVRAGMIDLDILDRELIGPTQLAFEAGGRKTADAIPPLIKKNPGKIKVNFTPGSRRAVAAVENLHVQKIREISDASREAIRGHIQEGLTRGKNPRSIARQIRGQYDPVAKQYKGGVLGLTEHQNRWALNAERQLRSGNPTEMRKYLGRKLRDRRHDRSVMKAINEGKPLSERQIEDMTNAYRRQAIRYRSETIARDQSLAALSQGQDMALEQGVDQGAIKEEDILQFWLTAGDDRMRDAHAQIPGMNSEGVRRGEYFETPLGPLLRPRDQNSPGSIPENTIQCRCTLQVVVRRQKAKNAEEIMDEIEVPKEEGAPIQYRSEEELLEDALGTADVSDIRRTDASGINESYVVTLMSRRGGGQSLRGCFKPIEGERFYMGGSPVRRTITNQDLPLAHREVLASRFDEALGIGQVPKTVLREVNGRMGSVQHWIEDTVPAGDSVYLKVSPDDMYKTTVFDYVIGNTDRHGKNILFKDNKPVLIDNGFSFPTGKGELRLAVESMYAEAHFGDKALAKLPRGRRHASSVIRRKAAELWEDSVSPVVKKQMKEALDNIDVDMVTLGMQISSKERANLIKRIKEMRHMIDVDVVITGTSGY